MRPQHGRVVTGNRGSGADERSRTSDLLITNQLLYQLSYVSPGEGAFYSKHPVRARGS